MKSSDLKVVAIILAIALFFTIVTSNAVSIASVVLLANGGGSAVSSDGGSTAGGNTGNSGTSSSNGGDSYVSSGDNSGSDSTDNSGSQTGTPAGDSGSSSGDSSSNGGSTSNGGSSSNSGNSSSNGGSSNGGSTSSDEWDKAKAFNFYKDAAHKISSTGAAGYNKIEFQALSNLNLTGMSTIDNKIVDLAADYMTSEEDAEPSVNAKGSDEAKRRFPDCTLTDLSKVVSATKTDLGNGNYKIVITMVDEDTPKKEGSVLGQVTNSVLYWEDIAKELANISVISNYENTVSVLYKAYRIEAEMTKDGKFVSLSHLAGVDISINGAKVLGITLNGKSAHLDNTCRYSDFKY